MASLLSLSAAVRGISAPSYLLYAQINWAKLQGKSSTAIGAPTPEVARATYTRAALRHRYERQVAFRSGLNGLARSIGRL